MPSFHESRDASAPRPAPIRFYGTSWVDHSRGYAVRRVVLALGALIGFVAGALLLRAAYQGLDLAAVPTWITVLMVVVYALCTALAFSRTLKSYTTAPDEDDDGIKRPDSSLTSVKMVGFLGVLFAYLIRCFREAPGEKVRREAYELAVTRYERLRAARTGNPANRAKGRSKRKR